MSAELGAGGRERRGVAQPAAGRRGPACVGVDPETFFGPSDSDEPGRPHDWEHRALAVCHGCAVRRPCLAEALRYGGPAQFGVVGGMTAAQRRAALTRVAAPTREAAAGDGLARARAAVAELDKHQPRPARRPGTATAAAALARGRVPGRAAPTTTAAERDALGVGVAR